VDLKERLGALQPNTTSGRLRELLPLIEERIRAGVRLADIAKTLREGGLDVSIPNLKSCLQRHRKGMRVEGGAAPSAPEPSPSMVGPLEQPQPSPMAADALDRVMRPDPIESAREMARYEELGRASSRILTPRGGQEPNT
jgi:hypothetical protein